MEEISPEIFQDKLLNWYAGHKRDLPWRKTKDPYKIWLSEVILQQTRVQQGMPYWEKFTETFQTIKELADAEEQTVLRLWQGLGYYSRARNMHSAAQYVRDELNGVFPSTFLEIKKLKGVGDYTAAAIASFAFGEKVAVVDGNVFRVLARIFAIEEDIANTSTHKVFRAKAQSLMPDKHIGDYNQAIMEFGAIHCKPVNPDCMFCVFSANCEARRQGKQAVLPIKSKKIKVKERFFNYLVFNFEGHFILKERKSGDVWQGLYDFPLLEQGDFKEEEELLNAISSFVGQNTKHLIFEGKTEVFTHILTHQRIKARFYSFKITEEETAKLIARETGSRLFGSPELKDLPKPVLILKFLNKNVY